MHLRNTRLPNSAYTAYSCLSCRMHAVFGTLLWFDQSFSIWLICSPAPWNSFKNFLTRHEPDDALTILICSWLLHHQSILGFALWRYDASPKHGQPYGDSGFHHHADICWIVLRSLFNQPPQINWQLLTGWPLPAPTASSIHMGLSFSSTSTAPMAPANVMPTMPFLPRYVPIIHYHPRKRSNFSWTRAQPADLGPMCS